MFLSLAAARRIRTNNAFMAPMLTGVSSVQSQLQTETVNRQAADDVITGVMSTDTERLLQAQNLIAQFQGEDANVTSALTTLVSNEETARQNADTNIQNQINANDTELAGLSTDVSGHTTSIGQNATGIQTINSKLGSLTSTNLGTLANQTVALSTQFAGRQLSHTALDQVVLSGRTAAQLSSLDTTSSLTNTLDLKAPKADPSFTGTVSGVSKSMVGLGNCDNTSDTSKPVSSATQTVLDLKAPKADPSFTGTVSGVSKSMVGLGNCDNTSDASKPVSSATQTELDLKAPIAGPTFTGTVSGVSKSMVGLGNCDNTSDTSKPVSSATQTVLDLKAPKADPSFTGNLGITSTSDVVISMQRSNFTKHYIKSHSDGYVGIGVDGGGNNGLKQKIEDDGTVTFYGDVNGITKTMVGLGSVDNTSDNAKPVSTAQQTALNGKASLSTNDQVWTGRQILGNGSVDGRLTITSNSGGANSLLIMDSRNDDASCSIYMRHGGSNKFQMKLNGNSDYVIRNLAQSQDVITLPIGGGIRTGAAQILRTLSETISSSGQTIATRSSLVKYTGTGASHTITLPDIVDGKEITILNENSSSITIHCQAGDNVGSSSGTTHAISAARFDKFIGHGTRWFCI